MKENIVPNAIKQKTFPRIKKLWDISPQLTNDIAVFPGDEPFCHVYSEKISENCHYDLSSFKSTMHVGAHLDAPSHYHKNGFTIDQLDLTLFVGECEVIDISDKKELLLFDNRIPIKMIEKEDFAPRVLFKTNSFQDANTWSDQFWSLSPDLVDYLANKKVKVIGIDTPSVDPANCKELYSHLQLYKNNMLNLEGLSLNSIPAGSYFMSALPLNIKGAEAAPVRAVLIEF